MATSESANRASLMEQFAEWLLMTPAARDEAGLPSRQKGLAELLGVSQATLSVWKKDAKFQRMVSHHVRASFGAERLGRVIDALYDVATAGSGQAQVSAAKTLLTWHEAQESAPVEVELEHLSDSELRALAQRVLTEVS